MKSNKLYAFKEKQLDKLNRKINKYLDPRAGLSETERMVTYHQLKELYSFWEQIRVSKEDIVCKITYHHKPKIQSFPYIAPGVDVDGRETEIRGRQIFTF